MSKVVTRLSNEDVLKVIVKEAYNIIAIPSMACKLGVSREIYWKIVTRGDNPVQQAHLQGEYERYDYQNRLLSRAFRCFTTGERLEITIGNKREALKVTRDILQAIVKEFEIFERRFDRYSLTDLLKRRFENASENLSDHQDKIEQLRSRVIETLDKQIGKARSNPNDKTFDTDHLKLLAKKDDKLIEEKK